jgi:uncharacterized protein YkwD
VTLSLLGSMLSVACGDDMRVVAPSEPDAAADAASPAPDPQAPGQSVAGPSTTTTTLPGGGTTTTSTTAAPTTTTTVPDPTVPPVDPGQRLEGAAAESLAFVNQRRSENGLPALEVDPDLTAMAEGWANQIAANQDLRHNPNLAEQAPDEYLAVGENVGYAPSSSAIDTGWWESDGHRENILRSSFDAIGIAFVVDGNGTYWGVQVFAGA